MARVRTGGERRNTLARRQPSVVIIDDVPDLRLVVRAALERGGFDVVAEAGDGRAGIEAACGHLPDVILLDLAMPVMDGLEALPALRAGCPDARIIVMSGVGTAQSIRQALAAGADGHLAKPASAKQLLTYVRELVDGPVVDRPAVEASAQIATVVPDAMRSARYGVLELIDEPIYRIIAADDVAIELLVNPCLSGTPLFSAVPELAGSVTLEHPGDGTSFEVSLPHHHVVAALSHSGSSLFLFVAAAPARP